jgi:dimethylamine monooxygenase subunit A
MPRDTRMNLQDTLSDRDFGLQMRFARRDIASFYMPGDSHSSVMAERRKWLAAGPEIHCALLPPGVDLLDETVELAVSLGTLERCRKLGELWEADFLLMKPDDEGVFRLYGGCPCFPSHWDLREKLGQPMAAIHVPVPGLNETLGRQIDGFLQRIKPGISWERANWGLSRTGELNLHPSRQLPRLDASVTLDEVWFRLEEQSLVALPKSGGILFGIRVVLLPMRQIKADPDTRQGLLRALRTMPEPMARYKGIAPARERLLELMEMD